MKRPLMFVNCLKASLICYVDDFFFLLLQHTGTTVSVGTMVGKESVVLTRRFWALPKCIVKIHSKNKKIMTQKSAGTPKAQHGTFPYFAMTTPFTLRWYPIAMGNHPNQVDSSGAEYQWKNAFWWPWCCGAEWPPADAMLLISTGNFEFETMLSILCQTTTTNWAQSSGIEDERFSIA